MNKYLSLTLVVLVCLSVPVTYALDIWRNEHISNSYRELLAAVEGNPRISQQSQASFGSTVNNAELGLEARQDQFLITTEKIDDYATAPIANFQYSFGKEVVDSMQLDSDMIYYNSYFEQPLYSVDYYSGKFTNGAAGAKQINSVPVLTTGSRIKLIADGYIHVTKSGGYIMPGGDYLYGSGLCWSTSTLGGMMDKANKDFKAKYGIDLFVFQKGDRAGHSKSYKTYSGRGYAVLMNGYKNPIQDYRFTVNPAIANIPELADFKVKVVMVTTTTHANASRGQSIGAFVVSNHQF